MEGVVTAADTGKPLAGMLVERDADGTARRHADLHAHRCGRAFPRQRQGGRDVFCHRFSAPDSGYLAESVCGEHWPQDAEELVEDFKLARGVLVHGRVLDDASGKPIAGASVEYHIRRKTRIARRRTAIRSYEFRNPALTDKEGRFTLTGLSGAGCLTVETPERVYLRRPLAGEGVPQGRAMPMGYTPINMAPLAASNQEVVIRLSAAAPSRSRRSGPTASACHR